VRDLPTVERIYGGRGVAGFYIPMAGYTVAFVPLETAPATRLELSAENVFFHEYAHHLMYQNLNAAMPLWLSEGFAEFFSTAKFEPDGSVGLGAPALHRADVLLANLMAPLPIEVMLGGNWKQLRHHYLEEVYGRGWLLTHYLTFNTQRKGQLERYLAGIQEGKPALTSAREAFGDLNRLESELKRYVRSKSFPYIKVPPSNFKVGSVSIETLTPGEAAYIEVLMKSRSGVTDEEAQKLVPHARLIAARFPNDASVQAWLAEAEIDAKHYDLGIAAANRALALNPRSMDALLQKGRAYIRRAEEEKTYKPDWNAVRQIYITANRTDPDDPRALIGFYQSYNEAGLKATNSAVEGLLYAFELAPQDRTLRWMVMSELVSQGRGPEAAAAIKPFAYAPHGGKAAERAQTVLDLIEARDLAGANKKIAEVEAEEKAEEEKRKKKRR
jgi:tetratricopeptide (TPR) repeat protein